MNERTKNSSDKSIELVTEQKSVAVYAADFKKIVNRQHKQRIAVTAEKTDDLNRPFTGGALSKFIFRWRTLIGGAAILVIAGLNFAFQLSFQTEVSENRPVAETPIARQPVQPTISENRPIEEIRTTGFEPKKISRAPLRQVVPIKIRQIKIAPATPPVRKKAPVETTAARLRRAEKILTGI